jgi:hypothetical protein
VTKQFLRRLTHRQTLYFIVYILYYIDQNDNLGIRTRLINRDRGSTSNKLCKRAFNKEVLNCLIMITKATFFTFRLIKLSLVRISFLYWNHIKILVFNGTYIFHIYFLRYTVFPFNISRYMLLTVIFFGCN